MGKYTEAEKLHIQAINASTRILGMEHPGAIHGVEMYTEAEKLVIQAQELKNRVPKAESPHMTITKGKVQESHVTQILHAISTVPGKTSDPIQVALDSPPLARDPRNKGMESDYYYNSLTHSHIHMISAWYV